MARAGRGRNRRSPPPWQAGLERTVGAVALTLIKMDPKRLGETEEARTADGLTTLYSSRERTLVDAVYDWSRFNSLPRAFEWIRADLAGKRVGAADLVRVTVRYGDVGTIRRIGALLEREGRAGHAAPPAPAHAEAHHRPHRLEPREATTRDRGPALGRGLE